MSARIIQRVNKKLKFYGINFGTFFRVRKEMKLYKKDYEELKKQKGGDTTFAWGRDYPILYDRYDSAGKSSGAYFNQDLYVARRIFEEKPVNHLDVGSRIDGFVAHVAVYRQIDLVDIREIPNKVKNINFRQADLMKLPQDLIEVYESVSSLHAIEHFGLGRYGDPVDYNGYLKAIENITKIIKKGGVFYFSVPIGPQRIEFNAHRVFSIQYLLDLFDKDFTLDKFSYIDDKGDIFENVELKPSDIADNFKCTYGCGIFELIKK